MGPIPSNAREAARLGALMDDAISQRDYVDDILRNLPEYTRSGTDPANPRMSRSLARIPIPETTTIPHLPHTYGYADVPVHEIVKQQAARNAEIEILRAAQALNAPTAANDVIPARPATPPSRPARPPRFPISTMLGPLMTFLELAMFPPDLNQGESKELERRRKLGYTGPRAAVPADRIKPDRN